MNHAIEILEERVCALRAMVRRLREFNDECGAGNVSGEQYARELEEVRRALRFLKSLPTAPVAWEVKDGQ